MGDLFINGNSVDISNQSIATFKDVIEWTKKQHLPNGHIISNIVLNRAEVSLEQENEQAGLPVEQIDELMIFTNSPNNIAIEAIRNTSNQIYSLKEYFGKSADFFRMGDISQAYTAYIEAINELSKFIDFLNLISPYFASMEQLQSMEIFAEFSKDFLVTAKELLEAQENDDWILLADLIEYELHPLLERWEEISMDICQQLAA